MRSGYVCAKQAFIFSKFWKCESMTRSTCSVLLALVGGAVLPALAADGDIVFRSDVSLVRVDAQVVDRDNRTITGLRAEDFILHDEGQPQRIGNFASENMPLDVVLLLDVSASMRPHVERVASAARQALQVLRNNDRVAIMVFDRSTRLRLPFRNSRDDVEREFASLLKEENFQGGTDITRGLLDAAEYVERQGRRDARRTIVILTDDQTEYNRDVEGVSRALTRADAVLSLLLAPDAMANRSRGMGGGRQGGSGPLPGGSSGGTWPGTGPLGGPLGGIILGRRGPAGGQGPGTRGRHTQSAGTAEIARRSGGDNMPVDDASALETTLARIRQRYALHFSLPEGAKPGQERAIEVELAAAARQRYPDAEVRYRRVYLVPTSMADASSMAGTAPTVITRPQTDASDGLTQPAVVTSTTTLKQRPGVDEGSTQGPLINTASSAAGEAQPNPTAPEGSRQIHDHSRQSAAIDTGKKDPKPRCGGWHRVDEPAPASCPSNTDTTDQKGSGSGPSKP